MHISSDLMLILESDPYSRALLLAGPSATGSWKTKSVNFDAGVTTNNTRALRAHYLQGKFPT